jgi:hypothetical protein
MNDCYICDKKINIEIKCELCSKILCNKCFSNKATLQAKDDILYCISYCNCSSELSIPLNSFTNSQQVQIFDNYNSNMKNIIRSNIKNLKCNLKINILSVIEDIIESYKKMKRKTIKIDELKILLKDLEK